MPVASTDLRRRVLVVGAPFVVLVIAGAAVLADRAVQSDLRRSAESRLESLAQRAAAVVDLYLGDRRRDVRMLARTPAVREAARAAGATVDARGLDRMPTAELETAFLSAPSLQVDTALAAFLRAYRDGSDFAHILFTERRGLNAVVTNATSDFVQADEAWWQTAFARAWYESDPAYDQSAATVALDLAAVISDSGGPAGVLKASLRMAGLAAILATGEPTDARVEIADSAGMVIVSADSTRLLRPLGDVGRSLLPDARFVAFRSADGRRNAAAVVPVNGGRWWAVAWEPAASALDAIGRTRLTMGVAATAAVAISLLLLYWATDWLNRRVTQPVQAAGNVASRVAEGDLTVAVTPSAAGGSREVRALLTAIQTMVAALRDLVGQIRAAAEESGGMAQEISASTEEMSASTQEMADTCQSLSEQATDQADLVGRTVGDAARIRAIAQQLDQGAQLAAQRNAALRDTAQRHAEALTAGGALLAQAVGGLEDAARDAEELAARSKQIEQFVTQARAIASQTSMLALNAAIEASRAGQGEGRGFAVVADEVRKLASQAGRAATVTAETVRTILRSIDTTRERLEQLAESSGAISTTAEQAAAGLREVADSAAETSAWTDEISAAAGEARSLVEEITTRLDTIAHGTESVVAASQEIAAAAEQQSASTEEIASSAARLAEAAERLTAAVSTFRTIGGGARRPAA